MGEGRGDTLERYSYAARLSELGSWPGSSARMEGDVMDKLDSMAAVSDFDPIAGSVPATKVEITVSCR